MHDGPLVTESQKYGHKDSMEQSHGKLNGSKRGQYARALVVELRFHVVDMVQYLWSPLCTSGWYLTAKMRKIYTGWTRTRSQQFHTYG